MFIVLGGIAALLTVPVVPAYPPAQIVVPGIPERYAHIRLSYPDVPLGEWVLLRAKELPEAAAGVGLDVLAGIAELPVPPAGSANACIGLVAGFVVARLAWQLRRVRRLELGTLRGMLERLERRAEKLEDSETRG